MKRITALILVIVSLFSVMSISVYADDTNENTVTVTVNEIEFVFDINTSKGMRDKFINDYINSDDYGATAYGLTCTLFGHDLESSVVKTITHKAKSTAPRCLQEIYNMEACTRCDYITRTLISSAYISCC